MVSENICAVTGASGYLGSVLSAFLESQGWLVYRLARSECGKAWHSFDLDRGISPGFFTENQICALVHCAWDLRLNAWNDIMTTNVEGSKNLFKQAVQESVKRMVFISTMSAFPECKSLYGRSKLLVEREALALGCFVVRPGLIYGESCGGMVGSLTSLLGKSAVLPLIASDALLYLTHEVDLCCLIERLLDSQMQGQSLPEISAVAQTPMRFAEIMRTVASRSSKRTVFIPVPSQAAFILLKALELLRLRAPFRSDSVISLANQNSSPEFLPLESLGIKFRQFV
jgi:nucleoside-diphosphate-sugar epimerase